MIVSYCYASGEWSIGPCPVPGCTEAGEEHMEVEIPDDKAGEVIVLLLRTIKSVYLDLGDGENPMPELAEAWKLVTGREIDP